MAYMSHNDRALRGTGIAQAFSDLKAGLVHRLARVQAHRATLRELARLSDRELADIGVHRANLGEIARSAADRV